MDAYPLLTCGFLNNRMILVILVWPVGIIGASKMFLLLKPMVYHATNHEFIVKVTLYGLALYLSLDTVVYLSMGNVYYCHSGTMKRTAAIYNMTFNQTKINAMKISNVHVVFDLFGVFIIAMLEITINSINCYNNKTLSKLGKKCHPRKILNCIRFKARVGDIDAENNVNNNNNNNNITIAWGEPAGEDINTRDSSNRNYLLICIWMYLNISFVRFQTQPGARYTDLALISWRMSSRKDYKTKFDVHIFL